MQYVLHGERRFAQRFSRVLSFHVAAFSVIAAAVQFTGSATAHDGYGDLVAQLRPSVVNIFVRSRSVDANEGMQFQQFNLFPEGHPFSEFFKDFQQNSPEQDQQPQAQIGAGAGFIISEDGYVVTNEHVIRNGVSIVVELFDEKRFDATIIGMDPKTDIAVLKIDADEPLPAVRFGDSESIRVGDHVLVMGNPFGLGFSVSEGIVSARGRTLDGTYDDYIQTDAAINSGNSGGPLFDMNGNVVGVNTLYLTARSRNAGFMGIGFSMSSNVVSNVVDQLIEYGATRRGWLGVRLQDVTTDIAEALDLTDSNGAMIIDVFEGPGRRAGLLAGDVIIGFQGEDVEDTRALVQMVGEAGSGAETEMRVLRGSAELTIKVVLGSREEAEGVIAQPAALARPEPEEQIVMGLTFGQIEGAEGQIIDENGERIGLSVLEVQSDSDAELKGIEPGDVVVEINLNPLRSIDELNQAIDDAREAGRKTVMLRITRGDMNRYLALNIDS